MNKPVRVSIGNRILMIDQQDALDQKVLEKAGSH